MADGFDVQALSYVAPSLAREWHISAAVLGPVFSAALVGILFGSISISMIGDRIGRRPVLIFGTFWFAAMTLLTGRADSTSQLLIIRLLAGFGLGGILPNAMSLAGEYSPKRHRVFAMIAVSAGFTGGAAVGGFVSAWLIPNYGWRSVFLAGGSIPLLVGAAMILLLPESTEFLFSRDARPPSAPVVQLFRNGRAPVTALLTVVNFMNLLNLYFLASWIPTVARNAGYSTSKSVLLGATVQVGGTIGALVDARLIERFGFVRMLATGFAIGAVAIALIGQPFLSLPLLFVAVFIAGWAVPGGQPGVNAFAAVYYPTWLRSTSIGWGLGIGRIGAIIGPVIGGQLIAMHWSARDVFLAAAIPAAISALAMAGLRRSL